MKVLYELDGKNYETDLLEGGSAPDSAVVLWDENKDGPLPVGVNLLAANRVGGALVLDAAKQAVIDAAASAAATAATADAAEKAAFAAIKARFLAGTETVADRVAVFKFLVKRAGN